MRSLHRIGQLVAITCLASCATVRQPQQVNNPSLGDVLTRQELSGAAGNAYSAVERLRPRFLVVRAGSGVLKDAAPRIRVFINGNPVGDVEMLKTVPVVNVEWIRRVTATAAFTQLGELGAGDGLLLVQLR